MLNLESTDWLVEVTLPRRLGEMSEKVLRHNIVK